VADVAYRPPTDKCVAATVIHVADTVQPVHAVATTAVLPVAMALAAVAAPVAAEVTSAVAALAAEAVAVASEEAEAVAVAVVADKDEPHLPNLSV
jgi:hypothetical protein